MQTTLKLQAHDGMKKTTFAVRIRKELVKNRTLYLLSVPVVLYFIIFHYASMFGLLIAFKEFDLTLGVFGSPWVGFKHFTDFFTGLYFWRTLRNTLVISGYGILFGFTSSIVFALLLNELRGRLFKKTVQTITYLPHFISLVVVCGMLVDMFSSDGALTGLLVQLGLPRTNYVNSPEYFRRVYIISDIWQGVGWNSIIYLAALSGIDQQLYEAATIDGAGRFRQAIHITLPGISQTVITMLILSLGRVLSVGYEKIILLYSPRTYEVADVISSYVYRMGLNNFMYSYSTAVGMFQSIINIILLLTANQISKKLSSSSLF